MPIAELRTARINYLLEGPSSAPVLVFSNSLGTNYSLWDTQVAALRDKLRILRYDTRGHGESSVTPGPYSIEQLANDALALLDTLRLDRVHFCGLSMGGMIGMWLAANAPQRLNKLLLCSTGAKLGTVESWNSRIDVVRTGGMKSIAPAVIERWFTAAFRAKDPVTVSRVQEMLERTDPEGYVANCAAVRDFDFRNHLGEIRVPTQVLSGTHDPNAAPADGRFLAERIPAARYGELNAAHISNIEDRHRFNQEIIGFLDA